MPSQPCYTSSRVLSRDSLNVFKMHRELVEDCTSTRCMRRLFLHNTSLIKSLVALLERRHSGPLPVLEADNRQAGVCFGNAQVVSTNPNEPAPLAG